MRLPLAANTRTTIEALNQEVEQIHAVADMIGEIAARTNLLALNATIEAARAGEAGKGFAVVANEVKQLATQTAHSTAEIARHIGQVRSATGAAVAAVAGIEQTITEISAIAGSIAAAVEQQGAATAEIARNVSDTAQAARRDDGAHGGGFLGGDRYRPARRRRAGECRRTERGDRGIAPRRGPGGAHVNAGSRSPRQPAF